MKFIMTMQLKGINPVNVFCFHFSFTSLGAMMGDVDNKFYPEFLVAWSKENRRGMRI